MDSWMPANTAQAENSVHITHSVTSCSDPVVFLPTILVFHPSSNPNRKIPLIRAEDAST